MATSGSSAKCARPAVSASAAFMRFQSPGRRSRERHAALGVTQLVAVEPVLRRWLGEAAGRAREGVVTPREERGAVRAGGGVEAPRGASATHVTAAEPATAQTT